MSDSVEDKMDQLKVQEVSKTTEEVDDDFVDPWTVASKSDKGIDYDKLIRKLKKNYPFALYIRGGNYFKILAGN